MSSAASSASCCEVSAAAASAFAASAASSCRMYSRPCSDAMWRPWIHSRVRLHLCEIACQRITH